MKITWKNSNWLKTLKKIFFIKETPYERYFELNQEDYFLGEIESKDIKELLALQKEIYHGNLPWNRSAFLMELNSFSPHRYLLVKKADKIIAYLGCRIDGRNCHITNIAVKPNFQKKGLGGFLLAEAKKYSLENDCVKLTLEVRVSNHDAKRLYRKFGFVSYNIKKNYYTENQEDAVEMMYDLKDKKTYPFLPFT